MPRNTRDAYTHGNQRTKASMRPRRNAAEYHEIPGDYDFRYCASMRPRRNAAEYLRCLRRTSRLASGFNEAAA